MDLKIMPRRRDWNRVGPPISCWFKRRLKRFDPTLELQYIPPNSLSIAEGRGMDPNQFPQGGWQICRRMKNGWLHKLVVFSLTDRRGNFVPPSAETIKILAYCRKQWRDRNFMQMSDMLEASIERINRAKQTKARDELQDALVDFLSFSGNRQFSNRVFMANSLKGYLGKANANGVSQ